MTDSPASKDVLIQRVRDQLAYYNHAYRDAVEPLIAEIERLRPMAESWESYEAAQERKSQMQQDETTGHPALRAGDELAHQSAYTPFHERWWQARGGHDKCTVCRPSPEETSPPHPGPSIEKAFAKSPRRVETPAPYYGADRLWEIHKIATQSRVLPEDIDRIASLSEGFAPIPPCSICKKPHAEPEQDCPRLNGKGDQ